MWFEDASLVCCSGGLRVDIIGGCLARVESNVGAWEHLESEYRVVQQCRQHGHGSLATLLTRTGSVCGCTCAGLTASHSRSVIV